MVFSLAATVPIDADGKRRACAAGRLVWCASSTTMSPPGATPPNRQLVNLAGSNAESVDRFLALLPAESDQMPLAVRDRLARIRRQVEDRAAKAAIAATSVTLSADENADLWTRSLAIEKQTGNQVVDHRQQGGGEGNANRAASDRRLSRTSRIGRRSTSCSIKRNLGVYNYAGDDALAIVEREPGDRPRVRRGRATADRFAWKCWKFRRNATCASRTRSRSSCNWKWPGSRGCGRSPCRKRRPIWRPSTTRDTSSTVSQPEAVLDAEVPTGTQATELVLPFELPPRDVTKIASLKGKLRALVPGRQVKFKFDDLAHAAGKSAAARRRRGRDRRRAEEQRDLGNPHAAAARRRQSRARVAPRLGASESLVPASTGRARRSRTPDWKPRRRRKNEVGVAYFFDVPNGLDGLTWVYETPAAIVELPIEYELTGHRAAVDRCYSAASTGRIVALRMSFASLPPKWCAKQPSRSVAARRARTARRTVAAAASTYSPRPASVPSAAASQIELAVVRPLIFCCSSSLRIVPAPRKPTPAAMPLIDARHRLRLIPANRQPADDEHRAADGDHHVGPQAGKMAVQFALEPEHAAHERGGTDPREIVDEHVPIEIQHG